MVMVHAPEAEKKAVSEGWATNRTLLGSNEFYIVGPESDPADIRKVRSSAEAYARIAEKQARFFSRGDNSGTHKKEMIIWETAGIEPKGPCYTITKDFMGPTLMRADKELGYFMVDSSTFYAKRSKIKNLKILFKGDPVLVNVYHGLVTSPDRHPRANHGLSVNFLEFMSSPEGQNIFGNYGKAQFQIPLYKDAKYATKWIKDEVNYHP
jgi:tungstate transport system substrate-binding protein